MSKENLDLLRKSQSIYLNTNDRWKSLKTIEDKYDDLKAMGEDVENVVNEVDDVGFSDFKKITIRDTFIMEIKVVKKDSFYIIGHHVRGGADSYHSGHITKKEVKELFPTIHLK